MSDQTERFLKYIHGELGTEQSGELEQDIAANSEIRDEWISFMVEQFLDGSLTEVWKTKVEEFIKSDDLWRAEAALQRDVHLAVKSVSESGLRDEVISQFPRSLADSKRSPRPQRRRIGYALLAAAAIILALLVFLPTVEDEIISPSDLYAMYYEPYPMLLTERSGEGETMISTAAEAYNRGDYGVAQEEFADLIAAEQTDPLYLLYSGICALEADDPDRARAAFTRIQTYPQLAEQGQWYTAMSWLASGRPAEAIATLEDIASIEGHYKNEDARDLLDDLR